MEKYEATFSLEFIIKKMALGECLLCETNVRKELKREFHILLCKKHRLKHLNEEAKKILFSTGNKINIQRFERRLN